MRFPRLNIHVLSDIKCQRFETLGDWKRHSDGSYTIWLTEMADWRHTALVLLHELVELLICHHRDVASDDCDAFDREWENEIAQGLHGIEEEAGCDRRAPYHDGHMAGIVAEHLGAMMIGVDWDGYCRDCIQLLETYRLQASGSQEAERK